MTRQEFLEVAELYLLGSLDPEEKAACDAFIAEQPEAAREILRGAVRRNTYVLRNVEEQAPPARLRNGVLVALTGKPARTYWSLAWAALAASLAIGIVWMGRQSTQREAALAEATRAFQQESAEARRSSAILALLAAPDTRSANAGQGRASYYLNPQQGVVLIAGGLAAPAADRTYQMWIIPKGQAPVPAGLFRPDAQGNVIHQFPSPVDIASTGALAISDEPAAGSAAPTTTPILVAPVTGP